MLPLSIGILFLLLEVLGMFYSVTKQVNTTQSFFFLKKKKSITLH